ncbi:hypothetical protein FHT02_004135 [Sphingomonas xinjiangensis]|uniref:Uncharacterized protein n=1 Tax=Sphingomonas xinjiangensis TaxID=643568 RepID=A0A840YT68_9SPHN|nr:hypothetical protein [Sphingomonas xinjiangensis]
MRTLFAYQDDVVAPVAPLDYGVETRALRFVEISLVALRYATMIYRGQVAAVEEAAAERQELMGWTPPGGIDVPKWRC